MSNFDFLSTFVEGLGKAQQAVEQFVRASLSLKLNIPRSHAKTSRAAVSFGNIRPGRAWVKIKRRDLAKLMREQHALWLDETLLEIGTMPALALVDTSPSFSISKIVQDVRGFLAKTIGYRTPRSTEARQRQAVRLIRKHYRIP